LHLCDSPSPRLQTGLEGCLVYACPGTRGRDGSRATGPPTGSGGLKARPPRNGSRITRRSGPMGPLRISSIWRVTAH